MKDNILTLSVNIHGNHVVQICLEIITNHELKKFIYMAAIENFIQVVTDKHGCCVV